MKRHTVFVVLNVSHNNAEIFGFLKVSRLLFYVSKELGAFGGNIFFDPVGIF